MKKLTDEEIEQALTTVPGWTVENRKLHREYRFPSFALAFGFMTTAALGIEKMNHHPEWFNVYNRVIVDLTTHDVAGISAKDFELARMLDVIASKLS